MNQIHHQVHHQINHQFGTLSLKIFTKKKRKKKDHCKSCICADITMQKDVKVSKNVGRNKTFRPYINHQKLLKQFNT